MAINNLADIALKTGRLDEAERHLRDARAASPGPTSRGSLVNESELARLRGDLKAASAALDRAAPGAPLETQLVIARHRALIAEAGARFDDAERWWRDAVELVERIHRSMTPDQAAAAVFEDRAAPFEGLFAIQLRRRDARAAFATLVQAQGRMLLDALARSQAEMRRASRAGIDGAIGGLDLAKRLLVLLEDSSLGKPLEPRTVLATLRRRHVLAYFVGAGRLRLLAVVNGEPRVTSVNIALEDLDRLIDRRRTHPGDREAAEQLGRALLPADAMAGAPARLHIVPSGPLLRVPFSALRVGGRLLLEHHDVALAPSVSWLALQANRTDGASKGSVVVADSRSDLQQAEEEARIVSKLTGAVLHIGAGATPAALKAAAEAELLHVVSHSGVGRHGGYLRLGADEVTAADIVKWKIRPQLVVLPTCASAATERNEMWESLAAAFLAAGSAHVVATLASVEDRVAAEFTRQFYRHGGARDPVDATARALRHMAAVHTDVASWSAFVAIGP